MIVGYGSSMLGWNSEGIEGATDTEGCGEGRKVRRSWSFMNFQRLDRLLCSKRILVESWLAEGRDPDDRMDCLRAASSGEGMKSGSNSEAERASKN